MNKVSIDSLRSDTFINQPVFLDEKYILLSPDVAVNDKLIDRLKKWHYSHVLSDGTPFEGNPLGESQKNTATIELSAKESEENKKAHDFFVSCVNFLEKYYDNFRELNVLPTLSISDKVKEIIVELKEHKHQLLSIDPETNENDSYVVNHSIKTTFLVLSIADFLKFPAHKQIEIGIAAMLHKLGMLLLPSQLYKKTAALTPREIQIIRTHPVISYKTLKASEFHASIYLSILEHHEHIDGSGYPRGLKGDKISLYGKILAVSSAYTAATTKRPFRDELDGHSGIMDLLKDKGKKYDENILRTLVYIISVYPVGTFVQLSNSVKAVVIKTNITTPKHPVLKLLTDENGIPYSNKPVLQTRPEDEIQITGTLGKEEITELKNKLNITS